jgi:replicative DNA helicase
VQKENNKTKNYQTRPKSTESIMGKSLPSNIEAERAILGAILLNDESLEHVVEILIETDFYVPAHQTIYKAMVDLKEANQRIDLITLQDILAQGGKLEQIGGVVYLLGLQEDIPAMGLIVQHAQIVRAKAVLRELITSSMNIISICYEQAEDEINSIIDEAEKKIFQISNSRSKQSFVQLNIWLKKTFQHLSSIKNSAKGMTGVPTPFSQLNQMTSGFQENDMIILAARPSMGKTALALNLATHAIKEKKTVGFFSLEMSAEQLTLRLLASESGINNQNIKNATISSEEWIELTHVAAELAEMKLFIDDTAGISIMELRAKARKLKSQQNVDMIIIDYLQLLHSTKRHENRHQEVSEISRSLKGLAKELKIPIIALSQLSRAVDSRMDKRPMLSDLRESGAIEQDADVIMFLFREYVYNQEVENPGLSELIIGKQRNGPTGTVPLQFIRELTKFENYSG